ncbi:MAG TPA: hypothetical protein VEI98_06330 [Xanthobacteraceae bacterium]|nr:hypothetical protein [Xanthobacteraceae bacterium]
MMLPAALILGVGLVTPVVDSVPKLNIEQVCQGIAQQGGVSFHDTDVSVEKKNCLDSENEIRDQLQKQWSSFSSADKLACTSEATMGGDSSYTELLTCLEMARDVRTMRSDSHSEPQTPDSPIQPAPPGHAQPRPRQ